MVLQINNSKIDTEITIDKFYSEFPDFVNTGHSALKIRKKNCNLVEFSLLATKVKLKVL